MQLIETTSQNTQFCADKHSIILDEVEIILIMKPKVNVDLQAGNESIVKNASSKPGQSFCKLFCDFNQSHKITYPFVVQITERMIEKSINTEICVFANSNLIYKFRSLDSEGYLNAAVQESNKRLDLYSLSSAQSYAGE